MSDKSAAVTDLVGMVEDKAIVEAYNEGFNVVRVLSRDGENFLVTRDLRADRVNFRIENDVVIEASIG
ncbi:hypothetical protein [Mycobacterium phage WXIN]|nr:hypothetical protein [Mycobacterium phage WXIN]